MGKLNSKLFIAVVVLGLATADEQAGAIDHSPLLSSLVEKTSETTMTKSRAAKDYSRQAGRRGGFLDPGGVMFGGGGGGRSRGRGRL
jgi:hypothetical protein